MWPVRPHGCRCGICWAARTCLPRPYSCCGRDPAGSWSPVSKASPGGGTWGRGQSGSLVFLSPHQRRQHELQAAGLCPQARGLPECRGRELVEGKEAGGGKGLRLSSAACCCREASGMPRRVGAGSHQVLSLESPQTRGAGASHSLCHMKRPPRCSASHRQPPLDVYTLLLPVRLGCPGLFPRCSVPPPCR